MTSRASSSRPSVRYASAKIGRSHRFTNWLKLSVSPVFDRATSSSSVHVMALQGTAAAAAVINVRRPMPLARLACPTIALPRRPFPDETSKPTCTVGLHGCIPPRQTYAVSREADLLQALTVTDRLSDLLPVLHHHAVSAVDGRGSILFQFGRTGEALGHLGVRDRSLAARSLAGRPCRNRCSARLGRCSCPISARSSAASPSILDSTSAVLVPLTQIEDSFGILIVGSATAPSPEQLASWRRSDTRSCSPSSARARATNQTCSSSSETCCRSFTERLLQARCPPASKRYARASNRLFGPSRTSVWLQIGARALVVLSASSDVVLSRAGGPNSHVGCAAPAAVALRRDRAEIAATGDGDTADWLTDSAQRAAPRAGHAGHGRSSARDRDRRWSCWIAPTKSAGSCRPPSKTCCCSTRFCARAASWKTHSIRSRTSWRSPIRKAGSST